MDFLKKIYFICYRLCRDLNHIRHSRLDYLSELKNRPIEYSEYARAHWRVMANDRRFKVYAKWVEKELP